jgi:hypothetical protein
MGFALDVTRGPVIRGAVGPERSALEAEAAVPQVRSTTPQTAAYWAIAAFNARHLRRPCRRLQPPTRGATTQPCVSTDRAAEATSENLKELDSDRPVGDGKPV